MGSVSMLRMSHISHEDTNGNARFSSQTAAGASPAFYQMNQVRRPWLPVLVLLALAGDEFLDVAPGLSSASVFASLRRKVIGLGLNMYA